MKAQSHPQSIAEARITPTHPPQSCNNWLCFRDTHTCTTQQPCTLSSTQQRTATRRAAVQTTLFLCVTGSQQGSGSCGAPSVTKAANCAVHAVYCKLARSIAPTLVAGNLVGPVALPVADGTPLVLLTKQQSDSYIGGCTACNM